MELVNKITLDVMADTNIKSTGFKIFKGWAPAGTAPDYLNVWPGSSSEDHNLPFEYPIIQFSAFSKSIDKVMDIRRIIKAKYKGFKGVLGGYNVIQGVVEAEPTVVPDVEPGLYHAAILIKFIHETL